MATISLYVSHITSIYIRKKPKTLGRHDNYELVLETTTKLAVDFRFINLILNHYFPLAQFIFGS